MRGIVIAGTHSGCGKTTVTLGMLAALTKKGLIVQPFKAGPDYIDTGIHSLITKRASRNLDVWMCGEDYVRNCFKSHSGTADLSVVEGVMGLYDGRFSTAALAETLGLPVILVVDAYGMAESAGAVVKGFRDWGLPTEANSRGLSLAYAGIGKEETNPHPLTPNPFICGVIFNRVGSLNHYNRLKDSVHDIPVFGYLPKDLNFEIPHRHLGLMIAEENPISGDNINKLAEIILKHIDMNAIIELSKTSFQPDGNLSSAAEEALRTGRNDNRIRIAVAYDKAFCFYYEDNLDLLSDAGAEITTFSLINDSSIPDGIDALYIGGGYPELYAKELSGNEAMLKSVREWALAGGAVYAECGGLMYLSHGIFDLEGVLHKMVGVFPFETVMNKKRARLGYREILLNEDCILGKKGDTLKGHEFHYSDTKPGSANENNRLPATAYSVKNGNGENISDEGYRYKNTLASYIHIHFGSNKDAAKNFVAFARQHFLYKSS